MKGRRGMKKKGEISSIESNPCMSLASCEHTDEQGSRGRKEGLRVEDAVVDVDFVRARGGRRARLFAAIEITRTFT